MNLVAENLSYKPDEQFHLNEVSFKFEKGKKKKVKELKNIKK